MKTTEIRVRPVIRHVVTRFTSEVMEDGRGSGSSESMGEFDHESYAEQVAEALRTQEAPRIFAVVEETMGEISARVWYAYNEQEAYERAAVARIETGKTYKIYSRIKELMHG